MKNLIMSEKAEIHGKFHVQCFDKNGKLKLEDEMQIFHYWIEPIPEIVRKLD